MSLSRCTLKISEIGTMIVFQQFELTEEPKAKPKEKTNIPTVVVKMSKPIVTKPTVKPNALKKYKENETPFDPCFTSYVYPAKNYWREQLIIETLGSFTGAKGTYEAGIDKESNHFMFKIPPNEVFNDPHTIHAYQAAKFGRSFGDDLAKTQAFKESTKTQRKNWSSFRHCLKFKVTKLNDLGTKRRGVDINAMTDDNDREDGRDPKLKRSGF